VWPEPFAAHLSGVPVNYGAESPLLVDVVIDTYPPRSDPARFVVEATDRGPELPDDLLLGLHRVGDGFLKAPEDVVPLLPQAPRHARRG
jgi:hypothetical protein